MAQSYQSLLEQLITEQVINILKLTTQVEALKEQNNILAQQILARDKELDEPVSTGN